MRRRAFITLLGGSAALLAASILPAGTAAAQTYPSRPITLVVPFPPGGATDAIARIIQDSMSQSLGQQIVIENIGGAGGMIAAGRAARAAPDGYTVLLHQVALAAGMTLYPNPGFDAEKDFVSIGLINTAASTLAGRSTLPPNNIAELVRWMKEPGQNAKIAHAGVGSFGHLAGVLVAEEVGATVTQVPYRGAGPALNDLLAAVADLSSISAVSPVPGQGRQDQGLRHHRQNAFRGLARSADHGRGRLQEARSRFLAHAARARRHAGADVERLNAALRHALADAKVRKTFEEGGMDVFPPEEQTPQAARALLKREVKLWGDVIRANNIAAH